MSEHLATVLSNDIYTTEVSHDDSNTLHLLADFQNAESYDALENLRTAYVVTTPTVKFFYPEPFIASPSFIHQDLSYLHILQYQF